DLQTVEPDHPLERLLPTLGRLPLVRDARHHPFGVAFVAAHAVGLRQRIVDRDASAWGRCLSHRAFLRLALLALTRRAARPLAARPLATRTLAPRALAAARAAAAPTTAATLRRVALARFAGAGGRRRILRRTASTLTSRTLSSLAATLNRSRVP